MMGLTKLDYKAPFPLENGTVTPETGKWISANLATVHVHLRTWHANWEKRVRQDDAYSIQKE